MSVEIEKKESEEMISITLKEYNELIESQEILSCLEAAGVDSWDGWDCAMEMRNQ